MKVQKPLLTALNRWLLVIVIVALTIANAGTLIGKAFSKHELVALATCAEVMRRKCDERDARTLSLALAELRSAYDWRST